MNPKIIFGLACLAVMLSVAHADIIAVIVDPSNSNIDDQKNAISQTIKLALDALVPFALVIGIAAVVAALTALLAALIAAIAILGAVLVNAIVTLVALLITLVIRFLTHVITLPALFLVAVTAAVTGFFALGLLIPAAVLTALTALINSVKALA